MAKRPIAVGLAALVIVVAGAMKLSRDEIPQSGGAKHFVQVPRTAVIDNASEPQRDRERKLGPSGISHDTPPPLEVLRDYSHAQSVYDQEAKPGDFVTPPAVSVAH